MVQTYFIKTFGCAQNLVDSERIAAYLSAQGMRKAESIACADQIIINTCMVRQMAEDRVYGLVNNLSKVKSQSFDKLRIDPERSRMSQKSKVKIIVTGCMVGMAVRDKSGKFLKLIKKRLPDVDEFLPIEEIGFYHPPLRTDTFNALVPISNGCNNFCTFCVVPFTRGREISRPYEEVIKECKELARAGYKKITLLGMNVNSYGADLVKEKGSDLKGLKGLTPGNIKGFKGLIPGGYKPVYVKHLGRYRVPTLFPYLLEDVCKIEGIETIDFLSSNPWDFSDELIEVIARNPKITRDIHLPVQSGSNSALKRMNRWYTREEYIDLVEKIRFKIKNLKLSTDIIVGFCGETEEEFLETVDLAKKVGFYKAYIAMYSDRPMTTAHKVLKDDVPYQEKKRRWRVLEELINQPDLKKHE